MKKVVLIFPDSYSMADFIVKESMTNCEANSVEQTLTTIATDEQIKTAETEYRAFLKAMIPRN